MAYEAKQGVNFAEGTVLVPTVPDGFGRAVVGVLVVDTLLNFLF